MKRRLRISLWILLFTCVAIAIGVAYATEHILPYAPIRPNRVTTLDLTKIYGSEVTPSSVGLDYTTFDVVVPAHYLLKGKDSITLRGWFVKSAIEPSHGTVILLHGIANSRVSMIPMAKALADRGFNSILYDSRANGSSEGSDCTFGYYEKHDVRRFIDAAEVRFPGPTPYAIFGNSLGASVAVQTLAIEPRLTCAVVESPFASLREVIHDYFTRMFILPLYFIPNRALVHSERIAHFQVDSVAPAESARFVTQPLMVAHGLTDAHISSNYGKRVFDNARSSHKMWHPVVGGTHFNLSELGGKAYQTMVTNFFVDNVPQKRENVTGP